MPSGSFRQADVQCPFYQSDDGKRKIVCEGLVDRSTLALNYRRRNDYKTQIEVFCCEHYKKCEVYNMIYAAKYDEED